MEAYQHHPSSLIPTLSVWGIINQDPLKGTHHALLSEYPEGFDREWAKETAKHGQLNVRLNILDLGVLAKLPSSEGFPSTGESACLAYLRGTDPRYVCLRIDAVHPVETVLKQLRVLLRDRHQQAFQGSHPHHSDGESSEFFRRRKQTFFRNIPAWLAYFHCYDLYQSGLTIEEVGRQVYRGDINAADNAGVAIRRVKRVIRHAESLTAELAGQEGSLKRGQLVKHRTFYWPPQRIL